MGFSNTFQGIRGGDSVRFTYRGTERSAAAIPLLLFPDHVVVRFGPCGHVVDAQNFVRIVRRSNHS